MIPQTTIDQIRQLLEEGKLSPSNIAWKCGVSLGTVRNQKAKKVDKLKRPATEAEREAEPLAERQPEIERDASKRVFCRRCEHFVVPPCVKCAADAWKANQG